MNASCREERMVIDIGSIWGEGCQRWVDEHRADGWKPYYLNAMFRALRGTPDGILEQMKGSFYKDFYRPFMTRFVRHPQRDAEQERLPRLMLFPDEPVPKRNRQSLRHVTMNVDGLHYNGLLLVPPVSRFFGCPAVYIDQHQFRYVQGSIARIHVESVDHRTGLLSQYAAKTVMRAHRFKTSKVDESHILMLPKALSEVRRKTVELSPHEKASKDIQAALNVSEDVAVSMTSAVGTRR